jgi:hypothetical protein
MGDRDPQRMQELRAKEAARQAKWKAERQAEIDRERVMEELGASSYATGGAPPVMHACMPVCMQAAPALARRTLTWCHRPLVWVTCKAHGTSGQPGTLHELSQRQRPPVPAAAVPTATTVPAASAARLEWQHQARGCDRQADGENS